MAPCCHCAGCRPLQLILRLDTRCPEPSFSVSFLRHASKNTTIRHKHPTMITRRPVYFYPIRYVRVQAKQLCSMVLTMLSSKQQPRHQSLGDDGSQQVVPLSNSRLPGMLCIHKGNRTPLPVLPSLRTSLFNYLSFGLPVFANSPLSNDKALHHQLSPLSLSAPAGLTIQQMRQSAGAPDIHPLFTYVRPLC